MSDNDQPPSKTTLLKWSKALSRLLGQSKERKQQAPSRGGAAPAYSPSARGLEPGQDGRGRVFGVRLEESLQYASVAISMVAPYVPSLVLGRSMNLPSSDAGSGMLTERPLICADRENVDQLAMDAQGREAVRLRLRANRRGQVRHDAQGDR
jgi:hypothetical protein